MPQGLESFQVNISHNIKSLQSVATDTFYMRYTLEIDDWWKFWDLDIPDTAWISQGQNPELTTLIHITDPIWIHRLRELNPNFLSPQWLH